mgnify:CR=1 FL=1
MSPGPWRVTFLTNPDDCNLHCLMCDGHSDLARLASGGRAGPPRRMDLGLPLRVLEERRGTGLAEIIPSTMGEPLLWPDLDGLLDLCARHGADSPLARAVGRDRKGWISMGLYAVAVAVAFPAPWISCAIFVGVMIIWLVPDSRIEKVLAE